MLIGAGNIGSALLDAWVADGLLPDKVQVVEPKPSPRLHTLIRSAGIPLHDKIPADLQAGMLVLAIQSWIFDRHLPGLRALVGPETTVLSLMAGKTIASLQCSLGVGAVVRAMPNISASVGCGVTGVLASDLVSGHARSTVVDLLGSLGSVEWLHTELQLDALTAVSSCGPAYVCLLIECMAQAGEKLGLSHDVAKRIARETVVGTGELLRNSSDTAARIRHSVTPSGGPTEAALSVLANSRGMHRLFERAITQAYIRARN